MNPVWLIEGAAAQPDVFGEASTSDPARERDTAERRLVALAAAVREHESRRRQSALHSRPEDAALYRRLRQICGSPPQPGDFI